MTYVVTDSCIECKYKQCVQVCPVDAFREGDNCVVIDPESCIHCHLCVPECPVEAIYPEELLPDEFIEFLGLNAELAQEWPVATLDLGPMPDADKWIDKKNKLPHLKR